MRHARRDAHHGAQVSQPEALTARISQLDVEELLAAEAAIHLWNGEMPGQLLPTHLAVRRTLERSSGSGRERATLVKTREVLQGLYEAFGEGPGLNPLEPIDLEPEHSESGSAAFALQSLAELVEGGPTLGECVVYVMEKFWTSDQLLVKHLGFTSEDACRFAWWMVHRGTPAVSGFRKEMAQMRWYGRHPHKYAGRVLLPPAVFLEMIVDAITLSKDKLDRLPLIGLNPAVPFFLATDLNALAEPFPSISRWTFLKRRDGGVQLLDTHILDRELPSAIHWGLAERLDSRELGYYGSTIGKSFERVVAGRIKRSWPEVMVHNDVRSNPRSPEIDLVMVLPSGGRFFVQCKARPLSPAGRWGTYLGFYRDVESTILHAAEQAHACEEGLDSANIFGNLIVLEAYFPAIPLQCTMKGTIGKALQGLTRPLIINVFDFNYLLDKIPSSELVDYLDWRSERLRLQTTLPTDEFDMLRAFLIRDQARWEVGERKQVRVSIIGSDVGYQKQCLAEADRLLNFDPYEDLMIDPPPSYVKKFLRRGASSADALIPSLSEPGSEAPD
ncbi:MAG TPA: hypothetical protein VFG07_07330 [Thermoplasmata archaeon]|nr:hypothetical protein [Thermoplasmata archaeon]